MERINSKISGRISKAIEPQNVTAFLLGVALSVTLFTLLSFTGNLDSKFVSGNNSARSIPPQEAGKKTVEMLNSRILHNTPNNVTGELVKVEQANPETLADFYVVTIRVINPTTQQHTKVYVKKDGTLLFLNHPRYFNLEKYRNQKHQ